MKALLSLLISLMPFALWAQLTITTTSSTAYRHDRENSIYPAFVDNLPYQSWTENGSKSYFQLQAKGGQSYNWKLIKGNLPLGLSLKEDGKIIGTPEKEGKYTFTVQVTSGKSSAIKSLTLVAEPYRAYWMTEAKFGVMPQWGAFAEPRVVNAHHIPNFEARAKAFNAEEWAEKTIEMGGKVMNMTVKGGDAIRLWPSTTPSQANMKTSRNFVGELIKACHARDIKFVAYFAPDMFWNPGNTDYAVLEPNNPDWNEWGTLNIGLVRELLAMGIDGIWVDVGGTPELYKEVGVNPKWFNWDKIISIIRTQNPYVTIANNPGIRRKGTILKYPNMDVIVNEGGAGTSRLELEIANPPIVKKKMAVEVDNLLDVAWSWEPSKGVPKTAKPASVIIENIKKNWDNGVTYMLNWPVRTDGKFIAPEYESTLEEIGTFIKGHKKRARSARITANRNVLIDTKLLAQHTIDKNRFNAYKTLFKNTIGDTIQTDFQGNYRGMRITVGNTPILLGAIAQASLSAKSEILIKEYATDFPVLSYEGKQMIKDSVTRYVLIPETRLEAGHSYIIAMKETGKYMANTFEKVPVNPDLRIQERYILNENGDRGPIMTDNYGALLNLKYKLLTTETSNNLALGKPVTFLSNKSGELGPATGWWYAENAVDGNWATAAIAGGEYSYTLRLDLQKKQTISQLKVDFHPDYYATEFEIYISSNGIDMVRKKQVYSKENIKKFTFNLGKTNARYIYIKALKPNAEKQLGTQMGIQELQVFK
ncbi:alpha-L-fucosidase [Siphonobacter sp. SORGH_AS_1065]|uniref:alpha-L-fucosidase n=1 Tax=Siphonobacter sp. SORGH_AS_1065 TaxID=3041795 RepID=UPI00278097CD|nr:alpha-L-fucosidase [Siphonobacter sp. SORGH_AS_1065]MDQ1085693.1 alpha-L-fucosidase [Siphonobacter sp. SORGH_AS_1065]